MTETEPVVNKTVKKIHSYIEKNIIDIPELNDKQKKALRQYSLDLAKVIVEAIMEGIIEGTKK